MRTRIATAGAALLIAGCAHVGAASDQPDARSLADTQWTIASINGAAPATQRKTEMRFTADRVSGNAGCNGFGGGYTLDGDRLTVGQVISTQMACYGAGMKQERAVLAILAQPMTVSQQKDGAVTLSGDAGTITLQRAD